MSWPTDYQSSVELSDFESYAWLLARRYKPFLGGGDEDDVYQEAMISAWVAMRKWPGTGNPLSYVKQHMCWDVIDYIRAYRKSERPPVMLPLDSWAAEGPDTTVQTVLEREELQTLVDAVRSLSRWQRARMASRLDGLSNGEIAESEGRTLTAIDRSFWKTRKAIQVALAA